jgi:hypothetical protein
LKRTTFYVNRADHLADIVDILRKNTVYRSYPASRINPPDTSRTAPDKGLGYTRG